MSRWWRHLSPDWREAITVSVTLLGLAVAIGLVILAGWASLLPPAS
ncbi:hypothetical protein [Parafrankia soli]|nr:hypothetical protein [Parafrankia soli]